MGKREGANCYGQFYGDDLRLDEIRQEQWAVAIRGWRKHKRWDKANYGEPPRSEHCKAPAHLQAASDAEIIKLCDKFAQDYRGSQRSPF